MVQDSNIKQGFTEKLARLVSLGSKAGNSQLKKRIASSLIMIPLAIYAVFFSANVFLYFAVAIAVLMTFEWCDMTKDIRGKSKWRLIGFLYISIPVFCLVKIRLLDANILFWMMLIIWATDIAAYFTGRLIGGKKLAPSISPGKTWSGFFGGLVAAAILGFFTAFMFVGDLRFLLVLAMVLSVVSQISDLVESKFKRVFNVKDSGNIIPGHGGVLDRLDGFIFTSPLLLLVLEFFGPQFGI